MCGIFGIIGSNPNLEEFRLLGKNLSHRGPDSTGEIVSQSYMLGVNRLSIRGLDNGDQPLWNIDKTIAILGNGEIYKLEELFQKYPHLRPKLASNSDIEVALYLYEELGISAFNELEGMFALCILDLRDQTIKIVRDKLGEKPFYFLKKSNGIFAFSSEIKSFVRTGLVEPVLNSEAMQMYFRYGFVPESHCMIESVFKLQPASYLVLNFDGDITQESEYWSMDSVPYKKQLVFSDLNESFLEKEILARLVSDVPIALALSSGLDSTYLATLMSSLRNDVSTFTIGFHPESPFDELLDAKNFASSLNIHNFGKYLDTQEVVDNFPYVIDSMDEPIADVAGIGYFELARLAKENGIKVLVFGQGADEIFRGYAWVERALQINQRRFLYLNSKVNFFKYLRFNFPTSYRSGALLDSLKSGLGLLNNLRMYFQDRNDKLQGRHTLLLFRTQEEFRLKQTLAGKILTNNHHFSDKYERDLPTNFEDIYEDLRITLIRTYLATVGLMQVDKFCSYHSIEGRAPFANPRLYETTKADAFNLPNNVFSKKILKDLIKGKILTSALRNKKQGFTLPLRKWATPLAEKYAPKPLDSILFNHGYINEKGARLLAKPFKRTSRIRTGWYELFILECWFREVSSSKQDRINY
jgi:asparagine synthase (glutamine-hydrolysing)